ncbi:expressed unknown protein [Seminavis robusta]|uniref:Uncharacterized protein n=1 Tax=Seminavis robusta TaxID=568900 RepID=A0A9N8DU27_9STRA|nr:expressed unknown protein [Seminavis robusta]|eukprot:Sro357_g125530.1 n/a (87) ;mRNA; r:12547-12962
MTVPRTDPYAFYGVSVIVGSTLCLGSVESIMSTVDDSVMSTVGDDMSSYVLRRSSLPGSWTPTVSTTCISNTAMSLGGVHGLRQSL